MYKFGLEGVGGGGFSGDIGYGIDYVGVGAGTKRRHAVMMMLDSVPSPLDSSNDTDFSLGSASHPSMHSTLACTGPGTASTTSSGRRRTRSTRSNHSHGHTQGQSGGGRQIISEAMDIEEEGRERKRVARR